MPPTIAIRKMERVSDDMHARFSAKSRSLCSVWQKRLRKCFRVDSWGWFGFYEAKLVKARWRVKQNGVFFAIAPLFRGKLGFEDAQIVPSRRVEQHRSRILSAMPFLVHEWNPLLLKNDFWRNFSQQGTPPRERSENVKTGGKCESRRQMPFGLAFTSYRPLKFCLLSPLLKMGSIIWFQKSVHPSVEPSSRTSSSNTV